MFLKLGQEAVLILAVVNRVSKAKTQVAVAVGIKEGICFGDSENVEIKQANHRVRIMQHTGWEFKVCPFDLHIEGVQEIEVLDLVDGAGHILGSSCVIWSCPELINTSAVFAFVSHDGNFIQGSVGNQWEHYIWISKFEGQNVIKVIQNRHPHILNSVWCALFKCRVLVQALFSLLKFFRKGEFLIIEVEVSCSGEFDELSWR